VSVAVPVEDTWAVRARPRRSPLGFALRVAIALALVFLISQAVIVTQTRPQDLLTGAKGMADLLRRSTPPNVSALRTAAWPALVTFDTALLGTFIAVILSIPFAVLAARNTTPSRALYTLARAVIGIARAIPDLVWALLFVTAVGLGPFPGVLAQSVHSIGMLGRLFAEVIEDMDMGPVEALSLTGASRLATFTHAVVPGVAPSLLGIALYRLDENIRSSLVLGFVGAGGIGFQLLTAMNLFQYRDVAIYLILNFALVFAVERFSAMLRNRVL
jgi:phosphonate transport system permease protein